MNNLGTIAIVLAALGGSTLLYAGSPTIRDDTIGLSKTSVFDNPAPAAFAYSGKAPNKSGVLPRAYEGAPPQIPHSIDGFVPIKADKFMS